MLMIYETNCTYAIEVQANFTFSGSWFLYLCTLRTWTYVIEKMQTTVFLLQISWRVCWFINRCWSGSTSNYTLSHAGLLGMLGFMYLCFCNCEGLLPFPARNLLSSSFRIPSSAWTAASWKLEIGNWKLEMYMINLLVAYILLLVTCLYFTA